MHHATGVFPKIQARTCDQDLVSHAGLKTMTTFIDAIGVGHMAEDRLGQFVPTGARHRTGSILGALSVMLIGGGSFVSDLDMLRAHPSVFGRAPSNATISRFFDRIAAEGALFEHGLATLGARLRERVWDVAARGRGPAREYTARDPLIIDMDHTLVTAHSDKEHAKGNYKGGYGYAPFIASIDYGDTYSGEVLAVHLRPGNAGPNKADAHIDLFNDATAALPAEFFTQDGELIGEKILIRTDSAGATRKFLDYLASRGVQFSTSYAIPVASDSYLHRIEDKDYWQPALDHEGEQREDAWVVNATDVIALKDYPEGTNLYLRAEPLHPGARATLLDHDGHRLTAFLCNSPRWDTQELDRRHRQRARCENLIKTLKNLGLERFPFKSFTANQAWASITALAMNLWTWARLTTLPSGHHGTSWDIKRWRYRIFTTAGKVITRARKRYLLLPERSPEIGTIMSILKNLTHPRDLLQPTLLQPT